MIYQWLSVIFFEKIFFYKFNDILISNHINTGSSKGGEVIYSVRGTNALPNLIASFLKESGLPIRSVYTRIGKAGKDYYFILRDTPFNNAMIIEYGVHVDLIVGIIAGIVLNIVSKIAIKKVEKEEK